MYKRQMQGMNGMPMNNSMQGMNGMPMNNSMQGMNSTQMNNSMPVNNGMQLSLIHIFPSFDPTFVEDKVAGIHQIYFTKETIDAYGDELDAYFMNTNAKDCCWYPNGQKAYWSSQSLE